MDLRIHILPHELKATIEVDDMEITIQGAIYMSLILSFFLYRRTKAKQWNFVRRNARRSHYFII